MRINVNAFMKLLGQKIKIHLPEILTGAGIAAFSGAVATAIIRTPKAHDDYIAHKETLEEIRAKDIYDDEKREEIRKENVKFVGKMVKAYWPTALCMAAGTSAVVCADGIHMKREAILAGQLGTAVATLKGVADRIEEKYGKEEADKLIYGTKEIEEKEIKKNRKTGKETEITKIREGLDQETAEKELCFCLDETHPFWQVQQTYTYEEGTAQCANMRDNLEQIQRSFQQRLQQMDGYVLLNDILKALHLEQRYNAEWIGWYYNIKDANPKYHNTISFHIDDPINNRFLQGLERCVWIKLTPDGSIFEELKSASLIKSLFERG